MAATLYVPILTGNAIDFIIGPDDVNFPRIVPILMQLLVTIGVGALAQYLLGLFTNRLSYGVARDIRLQAMDKLEVVPLKTIDTNSHGDILSRVITDVNQVSEGLLMGFTQLFSGVITIVGTLGFMFSVDARIAAVVVRGHAAFAAGGQLRRPPHLQHVQAAERHARRIDGAGGGDGRQPEGRARPSAMRARMKPRSTRSTSACAARACAPSSFPPSPTPARALSTAWSTRCVCLFGRARWRWTAA